MEKINIIEKFKLFSEHWAPKIIGELNGQYVKLVKLKGPFIWHKHVNEDEFFYVIKGCLKIELREKILELNENEFVIIPKGVEHKPVAKEEVFVMLFEPKTTINTGNVKGKRTKEKLEKL